ncbi:MAG TPA: hypothetical protein VII42_06275 [Caulobacteraceae bacterium]
MSYFAAIALIVISTVVAGLATWLVDGAISLDTRRRHYEVGGQVFQQVGIMVSVLMAFVFSEVWGEYRTAAMAINGECASLHGAAMLADALPAAAGLPLERAISTYVATVVHTEWPVMAMRHTSPLAVQQFESLLRLAANLPLARPVDAANQAQIVSLLAQAHAFRETRTFELNQGMPMVMWIMLIGISVVLMGFVVFAGVENPGHIIFACAFTACTVLVLVLVRMLDFPFEGALALSSADFSKLLGQATALARGGAP